MRVRTEQGAMRSCDVKTSMGSRTVIVVPSLPAHGFASGVSPGFGGVSAPSA